MQLQHVRIHTYMQMPHASSEIPWKHIMQTNWRCIDTLYMHVRKCTVHYDNAVGHHIAYQAYHIKGKMHAPKYIHVCWYMNTYMNILAYKWYIWVCENMHINHTYPLYFIHTTTIKCKMHSKHTPTWALVSVSYLHMWCPRMLCGSKNELKFKSNPSPW